jgi:phosphomannomutase
MDGTLTPPRKPMESSIMSALDKLSAISDVAIVTGSDFDYIMEQCGQYLKSGRSMSNFLLLPCNGTQKYSFVGGEWVKDSGLDMRSHVGEGVYQKLLLTLLERLYITQMFHYKKIPASGNFITYRGSLINWCPIGRKATEKDRKIFSAYDKEHGVREKNLKILQEDVSFKDISFSMGGNTSIDIYPVGWDKTYALNYYEGRNHWFVGDRCTVESGNDKPIYDKIKQSHPNQAFEVKKTSDTIKIINRIITELLKDR